MTGRNFHLRVDTLKPNGDGRSNAGKAAASNQYIERENAVEVGEIDLWATIDRIKGAEGTKVIDPAQINAEQSPDLAPGAVTGPDDTWIREPAGREAGKGGAFQSYIERDEAIERAAKGDPIAKDMMAFSFGSIGETPEERAEFWQKIETHMPGRQVHQFQNDPRAAA